SIPASESLRSLSSRMGSGGLSRRFPPAFSSVVSGARRCFLPGRFLLRSLCVFLGSRARFLDFSGIWFLAASRLEYGGQRRLAIIADVGKSRERGRQMSGMQGIEGAGKLLGPALGGLLAAWSLRMPFFAHAALAFLAIVPSFFLVGESAPATSRDASKKDENQINTRALLAMMLEGKYLSFLTAQFFASMTRGVLWGGTLLLYVTYAFDAGPQLLGGLATTSSIVGIPITFSCGYLMDRFGRKTTMVPG